MEKINVLGVNVDAIDMPMALEVIDGWIARREHRKVSYIHNSARVAVDIPSETSATAWWNNGCRKSGK